MFKNVAAKFMVFAFDSTTNLPKTGDAANITAYVSKDYGTVTVLADTTATEMDSTNAKGYYLFDAAQGETNGDCLMVSAKSSTSNIVVVGAPAVIYTRPTTGWLAPTTAGRTLDVSAGGEAGVDWANVGSPTTSLALTNTTIAVTQKVDVDTIKTNPVVNAGTITFPTTATLASTTNITAGTVTTATNVTNVNGIANNVITAASINADAITAAKIADGAIDAGTFAANAITATAIAADAITAAKIANGAIDAATFAADVDAEILSYIVDDATRIDASALNTATGTTIPAIIVDTAEIGAAGAGLSAVPWNAAWDAEVQSECTDALNAYDAPTKAELDSGLDALPTANENADALLDRAAGIETGTTLREGLRLFLAVLAGKVSGGGTTTQTIRNKADDKDRIVATVDADGNRTAITYDVT